MPIYEYSCHSCHKIFEEWHKHADDIRSVPCPACNAEAERLISSTSFMLKGGGWYVTEYGNRKSEGAAAADTAGAADAAGVTASASGGEKQESPAAAAPDKPKAKSEPAAKAAD